MTSCFVCATSLEGFDEAAANHHINLCLDGGGPSTSATSRGDNASTDIAFRPKQDNDTCPICDVKVPEDVKLEEHVEACLLAQGEQNGSHAVPNDADVCPSCLMDWSEMGVLYDEDRNTHVADCLAQQQALSEDEEDDLDVVDENGHKLSSSQLKALLSSNGLSNGFGKLASAMKGKARQQDNVTSDLIPQLAILFEKAFSSSRSSTRSAVLCTPKVQHVKSQWGDFGWGCGYRNAQMVFSALRHVEQYRNLFGQPSSNAADDAPISNGKRKSPDEDLSEVAEVPAISELQEMAEKAWNTGFDPLGKKHFKGKLVGSKRWIGTSEVYVMYTWLGIRATVIDFPKATGPNSTHTALTKWVFDYFQADLPSADEGTDKNAFNVLMQSNGSSIKIMEDKMPLYLQHQGHSRTIIGVETTKKGDLNLLLFDPGKKIPQKLRSLADASANKKAKTSTSSTAPDLKLLDMFRVNLKSLSRNQEYQILRIETHGDALTADEKLERRIIRSLEVK